MDASHSVLVRIISALLLLFFCRFVFGSIYSDMYTRWRKKNEAEKSWNEYAITADWTARQCALDVCILYFALLLLFFFVQFVSLLLVLSVLVYKIVCMCVCLLFFFALFAFGLFFSFFIRFSFTDRFTSKNFNRCLDRARVTVCMLCTPRLLLLPLLCECVNVHLIFSLNYADLRSFVRWPGEMRKSTQQDREN